MLPMGSMCSIVGRSGDGASRRHGVKGWGRSGTEGGVVDLVARRQASSCQRRSWGANGGAPMARDAPDSNYFFFRSAVSSKVAPHFATTAHNVQGPRRRVTVLQRHGAAPRVWAVRVTTAHERKRGGGERARAGKERVRVGA